MTVDVAELTNVPLRDAKVPLRGAEQGVKSVPLSAWTPPGTEEAAKFVFGNTPDMVEFFSQKMGYPYPWVKYDQVVLREFSGAMETTSATGFTESELRLAGAPPDMSPTFEEAWPVFTYEDVVAHELAHHWFGDMVTCRSLGSIWLNESFATFWHSMWNAKAHGEDDLTYQRWTYLNRYVDYVRSTGSVRPMEYLRYKDPGAMYQEQTTYVKGSLVLHMIRHFLGEADFDRMIAAYLKKHEFSNVDSADLKEAIERAAGRNLTWFFEDWVVGGGGHPRFDVSYRWSPERKQVDLTVKQIQADLPFENEFRPPGRDRDRGRRRGEDPHGRALRLVDHGRAAGGEPSDARDVRQGRLAGLRSGVHAADHGGAGRAVGRRPRGEAAGGAAARRTTSATIRGRSTR